MKLQSPLLVGVIIPAGLMVANRNGHQPGQLAALARSAASQWAVELSIKPDSVAAGDLDMTVSVLSARSGYLTLLQRGTDDREDIVFPNELDKDNRIEANQPLTLPRESWKWKAAPPAGEGRLLAVVSEKQVDMSLQANPNEMTYGAASVAYRERE